MSGLRDEAEALAGALELGVCDVAEVIAWSDAQLLREGPPPEAFCDVSLSHGRHPQDVAGMLRRCPGAPDRSNVGRLLVALVADRMKRDAGRADEIASALDRMALAGEIEDPGLRGIASWVRDALDLADAGMVRESREEVVGRMAEALDQAASDAAATWSFAVIAGKPNA